MKRTAFTIARQPDGVFLTAGDKCTRVADPIKVRSIGTRLADKVTLVEIKFKTIVGDARSETFPFSYLHRERWDKIKVRVGDQGYVWPEDRNVSNEILRQLAAEQPKRRFFLVSAPGWYEAEFVVPGKVFSPPGCGTDYRIDPDSDAHIGAFVCGKGSLEGWQETVAKPARKSSCLRVAVAAAFAAPLLRPMGMDSFAINWFSNTSDGGTTMLFAAASVAGLIGAGGLPGWADSEPGLEDQARGHRDCVLPLDESGDGSGKVPLKDKAKILAFMIARNRPRRLSKKHERANALQNREYRIIAQSSSELALSQVAIDAGGRRLGGEEVRFIDVCASGPGSLGIFDGAITTRPGKSDRETTKALIEQMKADAEANQGFAFHEFLRNYFDDAEALSKVRAYKDRFESKVSVASHNAGRGDQYEKQTCWIRMLRHIPAARARSGRRSARSRSNVGPSCQRQKENHQWQISLLFTAPGMAPGATVTLRQRCAGWGTRFSHQPIPAWASALIWRTKPLPSKPTFAT
jgi:Domain of unknown function (DUF927)